LILIKVQIETAQYIVGTQKEGLTMYNHILVPVDFDHEAMVAKAKEVAQRLLSDGGKITVLHVRENVPGYVATSIPAEILAANEADYKQKLADLTAGFGPVANAMLLHGNAGRVILDQIKALDVDCSIIASHQPGLQDYFLGSTAARVVRHAGCCVHVMR